MRLKLALVLSLLTCLGFVGCSDPAPTPPAETPAPAGGGTLPTDGSTKAQNAPQEGALKAPIKD